MEANVCLEIKIHCSIAAKINSICHFLRVIEQTLEKSISTEINFKLSVLSMIQIQLSAELSEWSFLIGRAITNFVVKKINLSSKKKKKKKKKIIKK